MNLLKIFLFITLFISSLQSNQNQKVSLQLQWKHQFEFAGFYMAKEKGFYNDAGLDVEIKEFNFGINIADDIHLGKTTFGVNYPSIILDKSNGKDIVVLNAILQSSPHILVSLKSSGIKSLKDFKNKKIMIVDNAIKSTSFVSMLKSNNISFDDMNRVNHTFNIEDLIEGKVDITTCFSSNELYELDRRNIKYDVWDPKDYGFDFYDVILFTSTKEIKNNPQRVSNFSTASLRGWNYAFDNIDETVDLILKKYNTQNKTREALLYEAKVLKKLAYKDNKQLGNIAENKIQRIYDIYNLMGLTNNNIDLNKFIYQPIITNINLTIKEREFLRNHKTIKVHNELNWPPYNFNINGHPMGYSIDYMNLLASKLDIKIDYISGPSWSEFITMIKTKKLDVMLNIRNTSKRREFLNFTEQYIEAPKYIFTNNINIKTLDDLNGKIVSVPKDFFIHKYLEKHYPNIKLKIKKDSRSTLLDVLDNKAIATISNPSVANFLLKQQGLSIKYSRIIEDNLLTSNMNIATSLDKPILRDILQKAIYSITDEEKNKLQNKWLSKKEGIYLTNKEKQYLENKKVIKMCIDPDWMPFEKIENHKHVGLASDYIKIVSKSIDTPIKLIETKNWNESIKKAKNRECDIFSMVPIIEERKKYMDFTSPYLDIPMVIATKIDNQFIDNITQILDKKIGIVKNYSIAKILKKRYPNINIVEVKSIDDGLEKVESGNIFAFIDNLATINYAIQKNFIGTVKVSGRLNDRLKYSIASRNDEPILHTILEKAILSIDIDTKEVIFHKWINPSKQEEIVNYELVWKILIVSFVIALFFIYRQYILAKTNNNLHKIINEKTKNLKILNESLEIKIKEEVEKNLDIQKRLFKSEKLASMGEMIGNIAHQWRQPLSVISTASSGMQMQKEFDTLTDELFNESCEAINNNAQYLSKTIDDFKNFIKGDRTKRKFNLSEDIDSFLNLINGSVKSNNINIILDLDDSITIDGYENELLQCLINLFNNAKDALQENNDDNNRLLFISTSKNNNNIIILIKDNANGIPEKILSKIFEPYFTTKHQSQGTGLGLHMTYNLIVDGMNGTIEVINEKYSYNDQSYTGAKFTIMLPLS